MSEKTHSQLSARLREARERQGITTAQAATDTRILQRYLIALEEGAYDHLPGDVYARGFIRNYADYLGLPAEELVELYRTERGGTAPIRVVPAAVPPKSRSCMAPSVFVVFFLVASLSVVAYLTANALGFTDRTQPFDPSIAGLATLTSQPSDVGSLPETENATSVPGTTPTPTATSSPLSPSPTATNQTAPVEVEVRVTNQASWLRIIVDGQQVLEGTRAPGWNQTFRGQQSVLVRAGNSGFVQVRWNSKPPIIMGAPGQVAQQTFGPE